MIKKQSNGIKVNIRLTPKQMLVFWGVSTGILGTYYLLKFGFEPVRIDLLGDYWLFQGSKRFINKNPLYIMMQSFVLPDQSSTLLGMMGSFVQCMLAWVRSKIASNALTRMAWVVSLILILPLGFTVFFDICLLITLAIVFVSPVILVFFLLRWVVRGKWK
jgi:hypothetical protein